MFAMIPSDWAGTIDATDPRNQFHRTALREARMATEYRHYAQDHATRTSLIDRVRSLFGDRRSAATQACCAA